jgi:predicted membrane protein
MKGSSHNFGNIKMKLTSQEFTGGSVSNVFGNIEIDLGEVKLKEGNQNLFINGVFGEMRIMLPKTASVSVQAAVNFGSVQIKERSASGISSALSYSTDGFENASAKLYLKAHQSMGNLRLS